MVKKQKKSLNISKEKKNNSPERSFAFLVGLILLLILLLIFVPIIKHNLFDKFTYAGVNFEKQKIGSAELYHSRFPIVFQGKVYSYYNLYLRNDPRKNNISINTDFTLAQNVSVSLDKSVQSCKEMTVAQTELGQFLSVFPFIKKINVGVTDNQTAKDLNYPQYTCDNSTDLNTVLIINRSASPSIDVGTMRNCFVLNIGNCNYTETVERYIVGVVAQMNNKTI